MDWHPSALETEIDFGFGFSVVNPSSSLIIPHHLAQGFEREASPGQGLRRVAQQDLPVQLRGPEAGEAARVRRQPQGNLRHLSATGKVSAVTKQTDDKRHLHRHRH